MVKRTKVSVEGALFLEDGSPVLTAENKPYTLAKLNELEELEELAARSTPAPVQLDSMGKPVYTDNNTKVVTVADEQARSR